MIHKLRRKFTLILLGVITIIISAVFIIIVATTHYNNYQLSMNILTAALHTSNGIFEQGRDLPTTGTPKNINIPPTGRFPVIIATWNGTKFTVEQDQFIFLTQDELDSAINQASSGKNQSGIVRDYNLRFLKSEDGRKIAFVDVSREQQLLSNLIISLSIIWILAILGFGIVSILLARWAVKPVQKAWSRQKQFIADASHELKTPLTVILSNANMLKNDSTIVEEKTHNRINHIYAESEQMKSLIESMIELAKGDMDQSSVNYSVVDFSELIRSTILIEEPIFYDNNKYIEGQIENNLNVLGEPNKLKELIVILLDNAFKYSAAKSTTRIVLHRDSKAKLKLEVHSQGSPIQQKELENIFDRFYRLDESRTDESSFGLGLAIARRIVNNHKGQIWAESNSTGNVFHVTLPIVL